MRRRQQRAKLHAAQLLPMELQRTGHRVPDLGRAVLGGRVHGVHRGHWHPFGSAEGRDGHRGGGGGDTPIIKFFNSLR